MQGLQQNLVLLITLWLIINQELLAQPVYPSSYDQRVIIVPEGQSRTFMFINQKGLFYYGETGMPNTSQYHGLSYLTHKFLEDYVIEIGGSELIRSKAEVHLTGDRLIRYFKNLSIEEEVSISDSLPLLVVRLCSKQKWPMTITPIISGSKQKEDYVIDWSSADKILYLARKNHLVRDDENNYPVWIGIGTYPEGEYTTASIESVAQRSKFVPEGELFYPGKINVFFEEVVYLFFIIDDSRNEVLKNRNRALRNLNIDVKKPNSQIEGVRQAFLNWHDHIGGLLQLLKLF